MATLDVSDAFGPEFEDDIVVRRRAETIDSNGESVVASEDIETRAVVCRASPNDLERLAEYDAQNSYISVVTRFRLRGVSRQSGEQYKPDYIKWNGSWHVVKTLEPYVNFGAGFVQAIAGSVESVDDAPVEE